MGEPARPRRARLLRTVRFRVTAVAALLTLVVLAVAAVALVVAQRSQLTDALDDRLDREAEVLADQVDEGTLPAELPELGDDVVAQVVAADGRVLAASEDLGGVAAIASPGSEGTSTVAAGWDDGDGDDHRLVARSESGDDGEVTIFVAAPAGEADDSAAALTTSLLVVVPGTALILALVTWLVVGRMLRPVEAIRAEAADIGGSDLHRRLPVPDTGDEVARLAETVNELLGRVEAASQRQQQFVADASHDLRSPLTRMRTELEVDLARPAAADLAATHRSVLQETVALQHLVDDLLLLARADAGVAGPPVVAVDLDDLVLAEATRQRLLSGDLVVDTSGVGAGQVLGDAGQLARLVANLADNARRYAGTGFGLGVVERGDHVVLWVADDGPGIPPEHHRRVFERFTRVDDARDQARGGSGLGLAIAAEIVGRHGGTIAVDPQATSGARLVVTLPVAPPWSPPGA